MKKLMRLLGEKSDYHLGFYAGFVAEMIFVSQFAFIKNIGYMCLYGAAAVVSFVISMCCLIKSRKIEMQISDEYGELKEKLVEEAGK